MKKLTITSENITSKQWSTLLIELNLIKEQWRPYAKLEIQTPGLSKIIAWGKEDTILKKRTNGINNFR